MSMAPQINTPASSHFPLIASSASSTDNSQPSGLYGLADVGHFTDTESQWSLTTGFFHLAPRLQGGSVLQHVASPLFLFIAE